MTERRQIDTRSAAKLVASLVGHDNVISISRSILELLGGDYPAAVLLCQSVYWQSIVGEGKGGTGDGYFWKSMKDWNRETALGEYQVREGTKRLKKAGIMETTIRKAWSDQAGDRVPTVHYRVDIDKLLELLLSLISEESIPRKINNPSQGKPRIDSGEIDPTIYTETTKTKTTTTPFSPSQSLAAGPEAQIAGGSSFIDNVEDEYIQLAAQEYCRCRGFGPEKFAGAMTSIRRRLSKQGAMTSLDRQQHAALKAREAEVQAMRARQIVQTERQEPPQAEIIHLPRPETDDPPIWRHALDLLRSSLPDSIYSLWIEPLAWVGQKGDTLLLSGSDPYFCSWVKDNYLQQIESALQAAGFSGGKVKISADVAHAVGISK
jgi:hypothetical protein